MYYQNYEDYMRNVLGYPINDPNIYESYDYRTETNYPDTYSNTNQYVTSNLAEEDVKDLYPDIYHLVNPMVCKVCETNTDPITKELVEKMTEEVYLAIEDTTTTVNVRVETSKKEPTNSSNIKMTENRTTRTPRRENTIGERTTRREDVRIERTTRREDARAERTQKREDNIEERTLKKEEPKENRTDNQLELGKENRQSNSVLRDLIQILILKQLLGGNRPPVRPPRPPFPGGPGPEISPRPPFPGGPGPEIPPRPPFPGGPGPVVPPMPPRPPFPDGGRPPMGPRASKTTNTK